MRDLLAQGELVEEALSGAGLRSVRLKGWHTVTAGWWADPAERTMTDLDVLVAASDADRAARALADAGYVPIRSGHTAFADHELAPVHLPGRAGSVEIHTALAVSRWAGVLPASAVLTAPGAMSSTDAVTHLIVHAQLHDEGHLLGRVPLRAVHELAVLSRLDLAGEIDWDVIRSRFGSVGAEPALDGFLTLARSMFDADVPPPHPRFVPFVPHAVAATAMMDRPRLATLYARLVYLPRALSATRMRSLFPGRPVWRSRLGWVARGIGRWVRGVSRDEANHAGCGVGEPVE